MRFVHIIMIVSTAAGCAPSRSYLFDPVATSVRERTGVSPEWRSDWRRSPAADARVKELLGRPLSAESAAMIAVLSNPELQAAYAEMSIAGGGLATARVPSNPHVEAELTFPLGDGGNSFELTAVQSVTDLLALAPRIQAANDEVRAARRTAVARTVEVAGAARAAFFQAAAAEQTLRLRRLIAEAATAAGELARRLREAGNVTELELARETVFEEEAQIALLAAERDAASSRESLNQALGLHGTETAWRIEAELPAAPEADAATDQLESEAITASLELDAMRWSSRAAGRQIGVARLRSVLPDLGVGVSAKREDGWGVGPAVTLSLPLFDRGQGERATANARLQMLQHRYTAEAIALRSAAREARTRLSLSHDRARRIGTRLLPTREKLLDEAVRQYNAMNLDAFELLVIRREHIEAEAMHIEALRDYWLARNDVDLLRAGVSPGRTPAPASQTERKRDEPNH